MDDLISRQEAIDDLHGKDPSQIWDTADVEVWINALPSAQPKMGKWYRGEAYPHHLYCSVCFRTALPNDEYVERWNLHMNYCPNCGAKMEGGK